MRTASPREIAAGYWENCPHCGAPVYLPIAGSKDSKTPVKCPSCAAALKPEC